MKAKNEEINQQTSFVCDDLDQRESKQRLLDSDSFSTEFFAKKRYIRDSESFDINQDPNQSNTDAKYYFAAGLGLCIASGFLFAFASPVLATLVLIVAITLIGMSYCKSNQDTCSLDGYSHLPSTTI